MEAAISARRARSGPIREPCTLAQAARQIAVSARGRRDLGGFRGRARRPSTTTRPTATGCSSTALTVAQAVSAISAIFPGIDRDLAVTGALLHDIGKLDTYALDGERDRDVRPRSPAR